MAKFRIAEVRKSKKDPTKSGRVKVRVYNEQNDDQEVKDDELPWATVMHPVTSAATSRVGVSPHGLAIGSRVICMYLEEDVNQLYPIIIGSIARGDLDKG